MIRAIGAALIAASFWGASFLLTKIVLTELGPLSIAGVRWWIASLVLVSLTLLTDRSGRRLGRMLRDEWPILLGLAIVGITLYYVLQNVALIYSTSVDVGLITGAIPVLSALLGILLLKERPTTRTIAGLVVAMVGVSLLNIGGLGAIAETGRFRLLGNLLAFGATVTGALYLVGGKRIVDAYGPLAMTGIVGLIGAALLTPVIVWEGFTLQLTLPVWAALLGLALGCSAAAYWLWWYAVQRMPVSQVSVFIYLTPVVSMILGVTMLHEPLTGLTTAGAVFVIGGVALVQS